MTRVRRRARFRGVVALALALVSAISMLTMLDLWENTITPGMLSLPANLLLVTMFVVTAVRAFLLARRGGHTEASARAERLLALFGAFVIWAIVFAALSAAGTDGLLILTIYAVLMSAALFTLLHRNWKAPAVDGQPLAAHAPLGATKRR